MYVAPGVGLGAQESSIGAIFAVAADSLPCMMNPEISAGGLIHGVGGGDSMNGPKPDWGSAVTVPVTHDGNGHRPVGLPHPHETTVPSDLSTIDGAEI